MRKKLTNTLIAKLAVPEGKQSVKLFDTDVGGLGVRKMASGVATFIFEMRPKGAGRDFRDICRAAAHRRNPETEISPAISLAQRSAGMSRVSSATESAD